MHWQRSAGVHFPLSGAGALSPESIAAKMEQVSDFSSGATYPQGLNDTMAVIMASLGTGATTTLGSGKPAKPASQLKAQGANGSTPGAVVYKSDEIFATLKSSVESDPSIANKVNAILAYNISNGKQSKTWTVSLKKGAGAVYEGAPKDGKKADVTVDVGTNRTNNNKPEHTNPRARLSLSARRCEVDGAALRRAASLTNVSSFGCCCHPLSCFFFFFLQPMATTATSLRARPAVLVST